MRILIYVFAGIGVVAVARDIYLIRKAWKQNRQMVIEEMRFWNSLPPGLDRVTVARAWLLWNGMTPEAVAHRLFGEEPQFTEADFTDAENKLS